eukprot:CAMPEP_0202465070 /NCGR_PEP_ID=MMETSP1360-20130828/64242_1 /ASSEMBLY_ACC=CAM_ASM_000848 /TAXON_ID=515479 /ORGANISM="Licmophora paradoxa, Strain CCMP2313" /LENGTH=86 /DNA_ID=CAMNT_0049088637 /DNA_START=606 /DNA_END=863 /DNA_ORIENTATION=-
MIEKIDDDEESTSGSIHMTGSIMAFPHACFLWNVQSSSALTLESLAPVLLYKPKLQYFFLGLDSPLQPEAMHKIKAVLREKGIVFE